MDLPVRMTEPIVLTSARPDAWQPLPTILERFPDDVARLREARETIVSGDAMLKVVPLFFEVTACLLRAPCNMIRENQADIRDYCDKFLQTGYRLGAWP